MDDEALLLGGFEHEVVAWFDPWRLWSLELEACSSSISHSTCKLELATLEGWIPQTTLGWNQETQAVACTKSWCSYIQLVLRKSEKIEIFHILLYLMVFINILLSFPFIFGVYLLCD